MDNSKQPGIRCDNILLAESEFRRIPALPNDLEFKLNINIQNSISNDNRRLVCEITVVMNSENDPVYMKVKFVGIFSVTDDGNMEIKQFAETNAPAILFPYIREEIHGRMLKAGLPKAVILPPLNLIALVKKTNSE